MGSIEKVEKLETYIHDLGNEIERVKKASEYLKLIEQFQTEIGQTSNTLNQTKDQLKLNSEIIESKLDLFQTTFKNIEAKQTSIEQLQLNVIADLKELRQQQEKNKIEVDTNLSNLNKEVKHTKDTISEKVDNVQTLQNEHFLMLRSISKNNKVFFGIKVTLTIFAVCMLAFLLTK